MLHIGLYVFVLCVILLRCLDLVCYDVSSCVVLSRVLFFKIICCDGLYRFVL